MARGTAVKQPNPDMTQELYHKKHNRWLTVIHAYKPQAGQSLLTLALISLDVILEGQTKKRFVSE